MTVAVGQLPAGGVEGDAAGVVVVVAVPVARHLHAELSREVLEAQALK